MNSLLERAHQFWLDWFYGAMQEYMPKTYSKLTSKLEK